LISFYCNGDHLFSNLPQVFKWTKKTPLPDHYSPELKDLVSRMLDPDEKGRPSADEVEKETYKDDRQRHGF
jgi:serine/threonine protein kinase